jgi:hypothetical protein
MLKFKIILHPEDGIRNEKSIFGNKVLMKICGRKRRMKVGP